MPTPETNINCPDNEKNEIDYQEDVASPWVSPIVSPAKHSASRISNCQE